MYWAMVCILKARFNPQGLRKVIVQMLSCETYMEIVSGSQKATGENEGRGSRVCCLILQFAIPP